MASSFSIFQIKDTQIVDTGRFVEYSEVPSLSINDTQINDTGRFEKMANKDQDNGYVALSNVGDVLGKGRFLFLTRDTYNRIYLGERTSGEHCFVLQRNGTYDYQSFILKGGSEAEIATKPIKNTDLSTGTGRMSGTVSGVETFNFNLGTEFAFFPGLQGNLYEGYLMPYRTDGEVADQIGRFAYRNTTGLNFTYWFRWRYITASLPGLIVVYDNNHVVTLSEIDREEIIKTEFIEAFDDKGRKINMKKEIIYPVTLDNIDVITEQLKNVNIDVSHLKNELIKLEERKSEWVSNLTTK
jgi:hypothetical protein